MTNRIVLTLGLVLVFSTAAGAAEGPEDQELLNQGLRQEAIAGGVIPRLEQLLRSGADINGQAPHGETALAYAIRFGRHKAALRLIELGADPGMEDDSGVTPLYQAAGDCNASRVVEALLQTGADVNHHDLYGRTALMNAAHSDCTRTVAVLILRAKDKVDIDARDDERQSASDLCRVGLVPQMLAMGREYQHHGYDAGLKLAEKLK